MIEDLSLLAEAGVAMCALWMPVDGVRPADALARFAAEVRPRVGGGAVHTEPLPKLHPSAPGPP